MDREFEFRFCILLGKKIFAWFHLGNVSSISSLICEVLKARVSTFRLDHVGSRNLENELHFLEGISRLLFSSSSSFLPQILGAHHVLVCVCVCVPYLTSYRRPFENSKPSLSRFLSWPRFGFDPPTKWSISTLNAFKKATTTFRNKIRHYMGVYTKCFFN